MNDSKSMLRFRESFRGYNKDDVNAYIGQINLIFSRKESELKAQIAELNVKTANASPNSVDKTEIEALKQKLNDATLENQRLLSEIEGLKKQETDENEKEEKSKLYDSMSSQVGNILIVANSNADKIISDAEKYASKIRSEAEFEAEKIKMEAEQKKSLMISELELKLKMMSESYLKDYESLIAEAQIKFSSITEKMKLKSEEMLLSADNISKEIGKQISEEYSRTELNSETK
ncbi:MAG: hypothetical protein IJO00_00210 [Clostridia bacterium]|nr:hypothetical protein [Clostridia bacterium]